VRHWASQGHLIAPLVGDPAAVHDLKQCAASYEGIVKGHAAIERRWKDCFAKNPPVLVTGAGLSLYLTTPLQTHQPGLPASLRRREYQSRQAAR
jgi:hypothetical protein